MQDTCRRRHRVSLLIAAIAAIAAGLLVVGLAVPTAKAATASGWTIVTGAPVNQQNSNLLLGSTCSNSWNCWAVGASIANLNSNGAFSALFEHWNGTSWTAGSGATVPGSSASLLWDVTCVTASNCWAVGVDDPGNSGDPSPLAEQWNGSTWSVVPTPDVTGYLFSVTCVTSADCWAAGTTTTDDGNSDPLNGFILHWDGTSWSTTPTQPSGQTYDQFNSVTCASASDCWAVGFAGPNAESNNNFLPNVMPNVTGDDSFVEHWDGSAWTITGAPSAPSPAGTYLAHVTCTTAVQCWAVGATMDTNGNPSATLVDQWDGTSWSTVPSPNPSSAGILTDVTCLGPSQCWASGAQGVASGQNQNGSPSPMIESWNGSAWSVDPSPNVTAFAYLNSVACTGGSGCFSTGFSITGSGNNNTVIEPLTEQLVLPPSANQGLWASGSDGGVFAFGSAAFYGSMGGTRLNAPIVGMASTPDGGGYWLVAADGGVFTFGDATFYGSMGGTRLNAPIVGMASTPDGGGYWLVAADGGVFGVGDATFYGSMGGTRLNAPIVGMASTPDGGGYWMVAADGGVFGFGDASFDGSMGGVQLTKPIVGMASTPDGGGYWMVASDGGVFTFGDAGYFGSVPGQGIVDPAAITGVAATPDGGGYWLVGRDGGVYAYGDANFMGSLAGMPMAAPVTSVAAVG
jgi:hypothetical protein